MAGEEDSITITLPPSDDGDGAAAAAKATVTEKVENKTEEVSTDEAMADMKRQLEAANEANKNERAARAEAERRAGMATSGRTEAEQRVAQAAAARATAENGAREQEYNSVMNAINSINTELEGMVSQKAAAMAEGKFDVVSRLDLEISRRASRLDRLEDGKVQLEAQLKNPIKPEQYMPQQRQQTPQDQNEVYLSELPAPSAAWIRARPQFFSDPAYQKKVLSAARFAEQNKGLTYSDPKYYQFIEEAVGERQASATQAEPEPEKPVTIVNKTEPAKAATRPAPSAAARPAAAAPAARGGSENSDEITLNREQRDHARAMFPKKKPDDPDPEVKYAQHLRDLKREGWQPFRER